MNMPIDGTTAGFPEDRPQVQPLHRPVDPAEAYLREVALFVALHLHRAPGVLWPEHDHPLLDDRADDGADDEADDGEDPAATPDLDALAAQIAAATGLAARPGLGGVPPGHLLVHQIAGAATWTIVGADGDGHDASLRYRLRAGEVLYVPGGWSRTAEPAGDARWTVVVLTPDGPDRPMTG
ncbi:hypothetical protein [Streptomyces turgidiscabies]|uniref:Cupin domain-containing protein n=1 Tax=Streptomyces turgidiscabies TaxID=85558 RepID=A0ABU0RZT8_9ACTN|nr:hypothetical protein [Streptomyces turgidiscabies]MDQ0937476.1 hypothetical protein [Streptomyces turgidiscabies]